MDKSKERKLIMGAKKDIRSFELLYEEYFPKIYRFVYHRVQDSDAQGDIVSEVFIKVMDNLNRFKFFSSWHTGFSTWIYRIAKNEINQFYRNKARQNKLKQKIHINAEFEKQDDLTEELDYKIVRKCMKKLNNEEQNIISLRYFEKMRIREVAKIFRKKESAMKVKIHRTIKKLKKIVEEEVAE